ncbi:MAG: GNAT family N-acetyltransferase/peptidase C39 family protein [Rhodospirillales bacterium]|nr:GNAT family N-acetyltransferase/peptidase C39 family protein [Rhodospirillales bacterium]
MIRSATADDLPALIDIENRAFVSDRISRRAFRYLLSKANAETLVEQTDAGAVRGYAIILFNRGTSLARLYSIAVDPACHRQGVGAALLIEAERVARDHAAAYMRLEVRADSTVNQAFYRAHGFRVFGMQPHYYEDDVTAVRMEKSLALPPDPSLIRVPYYPQTLDFTCGPAAVLMAMRALDPGVPFDQTTEIRLWRESTTVFMTSGLGGCSPEGLALAAQRRGFSVELHLSDRGVLFVDSVRSQRKREVIRLVQADFREQLATSGVTIVLRPLSLTAMRRSCEDGKIPVVLISSYRFDRAKQPHWVVVTGFDETYVYLHDPNVDEDLDKTPTDCMQIPVLQSDFSKMARYGKTQQQAALVIGKERI